MNCLIKTLFMLPIVAICFSVTANAESFKIKKMSVGKAMAEIQKQTGYSFVFASEDLNVDKTVSVDAEDLDDAISQVLSGQSVTWNIKGKSIVVQKVPESVREPISDSRLVRGIILDENGLGVAGASVIIKGGTRGVIADENGRFALDASQGEIFVVSFLGYEDKDKARS